MVGGCSSLSYSSSSTFIATTTLSSSLKLNPQSFIFHLNLRKPAPLRCASSLTMESPKPILDFEKFDDGFVQKLVYDALVWSSLHGLVVGDKTHQVKFLSFDVWVLCSDNVWCKSQNLWISFIADWLIDWSLCFDLQRSGTVPGVGMMHAPIALLPTPFPESYWNQACEVAPVFNELVDRISLDGKFIQDSLSRF